MEWRSPACPRHLRHSTRVAGQAGCSGPIHARAGVDECGVQRLCGRVEVAACMRRLNRAAGCAAPTYATHTEGVELLSRLVQIFDEKLIQGPLAHYFAATK